MDESLLIDPSAHIPHGGYCYTIKQITYGKNGLPTMHQNVCPFWDYDETKPSQMYGYCHYLHCGDWEDPGLGLLWDKCKECGINDEYDA